MTKERSKSLADNSIYYLFYNVLNMLFPFLSGIYVSRVLFPADIGLITSAQNLAQYFVILSFLGIPTYGLREMAKLRNDFEERSKVYSELYVLNFISTIVFLVIYLTIIVSVHKYRECLNLYLIVGISIALNIFNISWLYEGLEEFRFISIRNLIFKCVCFCVLVVFVKDADDYLIYAGVNVIGTAGNYLLNMAFSKKYIKFRLYGLNIRRHFKSVIYLVVVNLAIEIYSLVDITMMSFICSNESISYYKYANSIQKILLQVINTFTIVLIPRISFYYKEGRYKEFHLLLSKALRIIFLLSLPMIVGLYYTADYLIVMLYSDAYITSAALVKLFSLLLLISPVGYLLGSRVLLVTGNENKMVYAVGTGALVNVILNSILIPRYSEFGAAVASIVGEFFVMVIYVFLGKKYYQLEGVAKTLIKAFMATGVMGIYLYIISNLITDAFWMTVIEIVGGVILYFGILLIMRENIVRDYAGRLISKAFK